MVALATSSHDQEISPAEQEAQPSTASAGWSQEEASPVADSHDRDRAGVSTFTHPVSVGGDAILTVTVVGEVDSGKAGAVALFEGSDALFNGRVSHTGIRPARQEPWHGELPLMHVALMLTPPHRIA